MKTGIYNLEIEQGSTLAKTWMVNGLDLDSYDSIRMQIRSKPSSSVVIWDSKNGGLQKFSDRIVLLIDAETTAGFNFSEAGYDVELVKDTTPEWVDKLLTGSITLVKEYTKPVITE